MGVQLVSGPGRNALRIGCRNAGNRFAAGFFHKIGGKVVGEADNGVIDFRNSLFCLRQRVNSTLLTDFREVPVNVRNQFRSGTVDGFKTGPEFIQLLALRPCGDVAEAILSGFDAVILADRIGNAFGFHFLGVPVFFLWCKHRFPIVSQNRVLIVVMELGMGNFMDSGAYSLHLAHTGPDGDALIGQTEIAVRIPFNGLDLHGNRRRSPQGFHENLILLYIAAEIAGKLGQRLTLGLGHIEYGYHLEHGDADFLFLHDGVAVLVQQGHQSIGVDFGFLNLFLEGRGGNDLDCLFALHHISAKLIAPLVETGDQGGIGPLQVNQHDIVQRIAVETAHCGEVLPVLVAFKKLLDTGFDTVHDFPHPFLA